MKTKVKVEPQEIPTPDIPVETNPDVEDSDINQWLTGFAEASVSVPADPSSSSKKRRVIKVLVCMICKCKSEERG